MSRSWAHLVNSSMDLAIAFERMCTRLYMQISPKSAVVSHPGKIADAVAAEAQAYKLPLRA